MTAELQLGTPNPGRPSQSAGTTPQYPQPSPAPIIQNVHIRLIQTGRTTGRLCYQVVAGPKGPAYDCQNIHHPFDR